MKLDKKLDSEIFRSCAKLYTPQPQLATLRSRTRDAVIRIIEAWVSRITRLQGSACKDCKDLQVTHSMAESYTFLTLGSVHNIITKLRQTKHYNKTLTPSAVRRPSLSQMAKGRASTLAIYFAQAVHTVRYY